MDFHGFFLVLHPLPTPPVFSFPEVFAALVLMVVREDADAPSRLSREGADAGLRAGSGALHRDAKEDQVTGNCFRRIGSALRPQCCPPLPGRGQTRILAYLENLAEQPGACCPDRVSFEMFTFLVTSH